MLGHGLSGIALVMALVAALCLLGIALLARLTRSRRHGALTVKPYMFSPLAGRFVPVAHAIDLYRAERQADTDARLAYDTVREAHFS